MTRKSKSSKPENGAGRQRSHFTLSRKELFLRLHEAEDALRAFRSGEVDALVVPGTTGDRVFTLQGAEQPYRILIEKMNEGAVIVDSSDVVLFCNNALASMLGIPPEKLTGTSFRQYVEPESRSAYDSFVNKSLEDKGKVYVLLNGTPGVSLPVQLSGGRMPWEGIQGISIIVTDMTARKQVEEVLRIAHDELEHQVREQTAELEIERKELETQNAELRRAQEELDLSHRRYSDLYEFAPMGYFSIDVRGMIREVNIAGSRLMGFDKVNLLDRPFSAYIPDSAGEETFHRHRKETFTSQTHQTCSMRLKRRDGSIFYAQLHSIAVENIDTKAGYIRTAVIDVTERELADRARREVETKYRIVADNTYAWEYWVSPENKFLYVSPSCKRITGHGPDEFLQDAALFFRIIHPDDLPGIECHMRDAKSNRVSEEAEFRIIRTDGAVRWISHECQPVFDETGTFMGNRGSNRDITERKEMEDALRKSEERYRSLIELSPDAIAVHSRGKYVYVNPAGIKLFGAESSEEIIDKDVLDFVHPDYRSFVQERIRQTYEESATVPAGASKILRMDGSALDVEEAACPITFLGRRATQIVFHDISQRKQAEELNTALNTINLLINSTLDLKEIMQRALPEAAKAIGCETAAVSLRTGDRWITRYSYGFPRDVFGTEMTEEEVRAMFAVMTKQPVVLQADSPVGSLGQALMRKYGIRTTMIVPLLAKDEVIGAIFFNHHKSAAVLSEAQMDFATKLMSSISLAVENANLVEVLHRWNDVLEKTVQDRTAELRKTFELVETIFSNINIHLAYMDRDFNFIRVNRAYAEYDGREPESYTGKNYFDVYPKDRHLPIFRRVVDTGRPYFVYEKTFDPAEHSGREAAYWDWSLQPLKDAAGQVTGLVMSLINVTDRKHAEADRMRLEAAVESNADAIVITDRNGIIQYVNPAFKRITDFDREEVVGRDLHILDSGQHTGEFYQKMRATLAREGFWRGRLLQKKKSGTLYYEDCTYSPVKDESGKNVNYVSIKRDITDRLRLESIAEAVNTMDNIGYIFTGVRHEIGNPINSLNMIVGILKSKLDVVSKEKIREYLDRMEAQLGRIEDLLKSLKSFNLYEAPELQDLDLASFFEKLKPLVKDDFAKKGIAFDIVLETGMEKVYADPRALQQVMLNILTNASDALRERKNPKIVIRMSRANDMTRIQVEDNGQGMNKEKLQDLFKPFHTTKAGGTGLGLVIVKKMLTKMNGTIEISSRLNRGTRVEILLPTSGMRDLLQHKKDDRPDLDSGTRF